ncbi:intercellular adhesion molecule 1 [Rhineura floridana]|uniref:intercellular adhesion molecule 1 n=1 Tax=Rhineura floridana TaxID=261503 RepID=UPI002AC88C49|nr:intercellular adhesion molecule 1 [Rhineura floridana]
MQRFLPLFFLLVPGAWAAAEGAQEEDFMRIWPENPVVPFGGSIVLNCSTNCKDIGLETSLSKVPAGDGPSWKAFNLTNVDQWDPKPLCYATCGEEKQKSQRVAITVYRPPERVELDLLPKMEVGKGYNLTCQVFNVAPIRNLTVTLYKGKEELHVKTFKDNSDLKAKNIVVPYNIIAQQHDHREEVICHTALDLSPEGPFLENSSLSKSLATVVFPMDPYLQTSDPVEINTNMTVKCEASGLFPAEEAQFDVSFAGKSLHSDIRMSGDIVSAQAQVSSTSAGEHKLICAVTLGPVARTVEKTVNVYRLPKPTLHIDHPQIPVNTNVTVMCRYDGSKSPGVVMQITDTNEILVSGDSPSLHYPVTARKEDNGRQFVCKVELKVDGHSVVKETSVNLTVFYGPQMNDSSCPSKLTWKDGSKEIFICSALGNPPPTVECRKDEKSYLSIGIQQQVRKEHGGIYHCNATNTYGSDVRDVTIRVDFYQINTLAISLGILSATVIVCAAGMAYYMYYKSHKIRKYRLRQQRQQQAAGNPMEQKCLNGNV